MVKEEEKKPEEENIFHAMTGFKAKGGDRNSMEDLMPVYEPPQNHFMKSIIHTGTMKRIRQSKEKSIYS